MTAVPKTLAVVGQFPFHVLAFQHALPSATWCHSQEDAQHGLAVDAFNPGDAVTLSLQSAYKKCKSPSVSLSYIYIDTCLYNSTSLSLSLSLSLCLSVSLPLSWGLS